MSNFISTIQKGWWSFGLPGYRPRTSTYDLYSYHELPDLNLDFDNDFSWLRAQSSKKHSVAEDTYPTGEKLDLSRIEDFEKDRKINLPRDFVLFIRDVNLHAKVRSCTDCYLELSDFAVMTLGSEDGFLIHFLSDSQYVLHWFLYLGLNNEHCVLVSRNPYGVQGLDIPKSIDVQTEPIWFCAPSFKEFIYRFWLENEIWFTLVDKDRSLTSIEQSYLEHYSK